MKKILTLSFCLIISYSHAQKAIIKNIELAGEKIIVHYDLEDSNPNNEYQINIFASKDKFSAPLTKVKGDVGPDVKPGMDRKVEWNLREEYGAFKGKLSLEIRGKVFVPFVKLKNFDAAKVYKRGKNYDLTWRPGNTNPIHIELYKGSQRVSGELNHPNNGAYSLTIGHRSKPGKDYRIKITDSKQTDEIIFSDYFKVSPKVPLLVKLLPGLVVVGGTVALVGSINKTNSPQPIPLPDLPN
jgi:Ser-Thr-rich glycosyl-phosphatidyl-inositol-anchored membrane family